jgi:hypothetical protein
MTNFTLGNGTGDLYTFNGTFEGEKYSGVVKDGIFGIEVTDLTLGENNWNKYEESEMSISMELVKRYVLRNVRKFGGNR